MANSSNPNVEIEHGTLTFRAEARLLQELGERLVAVPEVALVELIKNAYDADAENCAVSIEEEGLILNVTDDGHGMTLDEFRNYWMTIGTSHKSVVRTSRKFHRDLAGQKGIGRFAVRFLGGKLIIESIAYDKERRYKTLVKATFNWEKLDLSASLDQTKIPFTLHRVSSDIPTGTRLSIGQLRHQSEFSKSPNFRAEVLRIVSPLYGLYRGRFASDAISVTGNDDPGFDVRLPGDQSANEEINLAKFVLDNYWARLQVSVKKDRLIFKVNFPDVKKPFEMRIHQKNSISNGLQADIRWFPRRKGVFADKGFKGTVAWRWVADNHGIAIVDRGFRVRPYGYPDDDWLDLVRDSNQNRRDWRTAIAQDRFPIPPSTRADPAQNPMLNLPADHQLIGAVFVATAASAAQGHPRDLIPSTDREGFLQTDGFHELKEFIRAGLEWLAHLDRERQLAQREREAKEAALKVRKDFKQALEYIENLDGVSRTERTRLTKEYGELAQKIEEVEEYNREARQKLLVMGAMGILAGFMTHEASVLTSSLRDASRALERAAKKDPSFKDLSKELQEGLATWESQLEYTKIFVDATQAFKAMSFKAAPQVKRVVALFSQFARARSIEIDIDIDPEVKVPPLPVSLYSGVVLNLFTNSLKAILAHDGTHSERIVKFRAFSTSATHTLEVLDTGIGIPPTMAKRVWDPLFTTTSRLTSPLGTGMGLGLTLTKQLVEQAGGKIVLADPPEGFATCFKVTFPV